MIVQCMICKKFYKIETSDVFGKRTLLLDGDVSQVLKCRHINNIVQPL